MEIGINLSFWKATKNCLSTHFNAHQKHIHLPFTSPGFSRALTVVLRAFVSGLKQHSVFLFIFDILLSAVRVNFGTQFDINDRLLAI